MIYWAVLPFLLLLILFVVLKWPAKHAMPITWIVTLGIVTFIWNVSLSPLVEATGKALVTAVDILLILLFAIWLLEVLRESKGLEAMRHTLTNISSSKVVQVLLVAWFFGALLEGAAGFGTPAAVVAPLLVGMGFTPLKSVVLALIANSTPVSFGAVGTPVIIGLESIHLDVVGTVPLIGLIHAVLGIFIPVIIALLVKKSWKSVWWGLFAGAAFTLPYFLMSFIGPELPSLVGSMIGLFIFGGIAHKLSGKKMKMKKEMLVFTPYVVLVLLLILSRTVLKEYLSFYVGPWQPLYAPWFYLFLALVSAIFLRHITFVHVQKAGMQALDKLKKAVIPLVFALGTVQLILITSVSTVTSIPEMIAAHLAHLGSAYTIASPVLGMLGSFITGSNTVSNLLFAPFQAETAVALGLSLPSILALQTVGGAIGNMIAPHNIIAASATVNASGQEGNVLRRTLLPALGYALLAGSIGFVFL